MGVRRSSSEIIKGILQRAFEQGLEGRVLMIQQRLDAARDTPPEHLHVLAQIKHYGKALPSAGPFSSPTIN